ncbi:MAG: hypothetical protein WCH04_20865 [Gammaproteobacteria bacterium]
MKSIQRPGRLLRHLLGVCLLGILLTGCTIVGPAAIHGGRLAYNEAIIDTDNQQMLLVVVRNRYGERSNMLAVASVTANVRVSTNAGIEVGVGDNDIYRGNLVPFKAGVIYEENPTISYTPVGGEKYARQLMSPLSVTSLAQLTETLTNPAPVYFALVSGINGIYNPDFSSQSSVPDARFIHLVELISELTRAHRLHWVQDSQHDGRISIIIDHYSPEFTVQVDELFSLLDLPAPKTRSSRIVLPVFLAVDGHGADGIGISTRSLHDLLEILSAAVEIPEQDQTVAISYPPPGLVGKELRVHYAKTRPEHASVAVSYRDGWFYIDEKDHTTKQFFRLIATLLSVNIAESTDKKSAPVLTVPVSR